MLVRLTFRVIGCDVTNPLLFISTYGISAVHSRVVAAWSGEGHCTYAVSVVHSRVVAAWSGVALCEQLHLLAALQISRDEFAIGTTDLGLSLCMFSSISL